MSLDEKILKDWFKDKIIYVRDVKKFIKELREGIDKRISQWEALDEDLSDKTGAILSLEEIKHTLIEEVFGKGLI